MWCTNSCDSFKYVYSGNCIIFKLTRLVSVSEVRIYLVLLYNVSSDLKQILQILIQFNSIHLPNQSPALPLNTTNPSTSSDVIYTYIS